jgi:hypothetical protein
MRPDDLALVGAVSLALFAVLSFVDGVLFHLVRDRLHARPASRLEHLAHTGRAVLFAPIALTIFSNVGGLAAWLGVLALVLDQVFEIADMLLERSSRRALGGLGTGEYVVHGTLVTLRAIAIVAAFALRSPASWSLAPAPVDLGPLAAVGSLLAPGAIAIAVVHVVLAAWPRLFPVRNPRPSTAGA